MEGSEVLLTTNLMGEGLRTTEISYNFLWTRSFMEPTQLLPHPGLLSFGRFALYAIQRNDLRQQLKFNTTGRCAGSKQDVVLLESGLNPCPQFRSQCRYPHFSSGNVVQCRFGYTTTVNVD